MTAARSQLTAPQRQDGKLNIMFYGGDAARLERSAPADPPGARYIFVGNPKYGGISGSRAAELFYSFDVVVAMQKFIGHGDFNALVEGCKGDDTPTLLRLPKAESVSGAVRRLGKLFPEAFEVEQRGVAVLSEAELRKGVAKQIGKRIKRMLKKRNRSQVWAAGEIEHLSRSKIYHVINGNNFPSKLLVYDLATLLDCKPVDFVKGEEWALLRDTPNGYKGPVVVAAKEANVPVTIVNDPGPSNPSTLTVKPSLPQMLGDAIESTKTPPKTPPKPDAQMARMKVLDGLALPYSYSRVVEHLLVGEPMEAWELLGRIIEAG